MVPDASEKHVASSLRIGDVWMWNPEAFGDIYNVTFQKNTISYTAVKTPMLARSINVYVVHVGKLLKRKFRYTYSGSLFLQGSRPAEPVARRLRFALENVSVYDVGH